MIAFRADADTVRIIEENRGDLTVSQFVRRAINARLREIKEDKEMREKCSRRQGWLDEYLKGVSLPFDFTTRDFKDWIVETYHPYDLGSSNELSKFLANHAGVRKVDIAKNRTVWRYEGNVCEE